MQSCHKLLVHLIARDAACQTGKELIGTLPAETFHAGNRIIQLAFAVITYLLEGS